MESIITNAIYIAKSHIGEKETPSGSNSSIDIDRIQKEFGMYKQQYCAMFVLYCYKKACEIQKVKFPFPLTASSQTLFEWAIKNKVSSIDFSQIQAGDIVIWRKFKLWQGHVGLVRSVDLVNNRFTTIEGNTSSDDKGDQRNGDGIFQKIRYCRKSDFSVDTFYLRGYIQVRKLFS